MGDTYTYMYIYIYVCMYIYTYIYVVGEGSTTPLARSWRRKRRSSVQAEGSIPWVACKIEFFVLERGVRLLSGYHPFRAARGGRRLDVTNDPSRGV